MLEAIDLVHEAVLLHHAHVERRDALRLILMHEQGRLNLAILVLSAASIVVFHLHFVYVSRLIHGRGLLQLRLSRLEDLRRFIFWHQHATLTGLDFVFAIDCVQGHVLLAFMHFLSHYLHKIFRRCHFCALLGYGLRLVFNRHVLLSGLEIYSVEPKSRGIHIRLDVYASSGRDALPRFSSLAILALSLVLRGHSMYFLWQSLRVHWECLIVVQTGSLPSNCDLLRHGAYLLSLGGFRNLGRSLGGQKNRQLFICGDILHLDRDFRHRITQIRVGHI